MFGLSKREQRWKAEQQAAELMAGFTVAITGLLAVVEKNKCAVKEKEIDLEIQRLENENLRLRQLLIEKTGAQND